MARKSSWINSCEICNVGLINKMDELIGDGISVNKAAKLLAVEGEKQIGDLVYSQAAIRARYLLHKGLREPHPKKAVHSEQSQHVGTLANNEPTEVEVSKDVPSTNIPDVEEPELGDLSVDFEKNANKAAAAAKKRTESELEKASKVIEKASRLLERIVDGNLKDNGTEYDRLSAASINAHGPGIIISLYRLGIDPEKAVSFYLGKPAKSITKGQP